MVANTAALCVAQICLFNLQFTSKSACIFKVCELYKGAAVLVKHMKR